MAGFRDKTDGTKSSLLARVKELEGALDRAVDELELMRTTSTTLLQNMRAAINAHAKIEEIAMERRHSMLLKMYMGVTETHVTKTAFQEICRLAATYATVSRKTQRPGRPLVPDPENNEREPA